MQYWTTIYTRGKWQDDWTAVGHSVSRNDAIDLLREYADQHPASECGLASVFGITLFDDEHAEGEGRLMRVQCRDYESFYKNSGGHPPFRFPRAVLDYSIGFDSDFVHRLH